MTVNNIIIRNDQLKVTIGSTDLIENYTKMINMVPFPKTTANRVSDPTSDLYEEYIPKAVDILMKAERRYTVTGYLATGVTDTTVYQSITEKTNAIDKRTDLRKIFLHGGLFYMYWEGAEYAVISDKLEIKRVNNDNNENIDGVIDFEVTMTLVQVSYTYG